MESEAVKNKTALRQMHCSLCGSETILYSETQNRKYHKCVQCNGVLLDPHYFLTAQDEKDRYLLHQNDVTDSGYQNFVSPIVDRICNNYDPNHKGLDFGSGSGPVITHLLRKKKYDIATYDPFFSPNQDPLKTKYDYIVCCEVIEHFNNPKKEFELLSSLLMTKGSLLCKTSIYKESIDFNSWWYKNDPTHVFFYTEETLYWIKEKFEFATLEITKDFILFTKR